MALFGSPFSWLQGVEFLCPGLGAHVVQECSWGPYPEEEATAATHGPPMPLAPACYVCHCCSAYSRPGKPRGWLLPILEAVQDRC